LHRNFTTIEKLLEHHHARYFVVPLQVPSDTQLLAPARGWNNPKLIMAVLHSFARSAPKEHRLVFKIHPMERGHSNDHRHIYESAKLLEIEHRVDVLDTGSLGLLTRHSAGMITINSTSGLSAIAHGVPLLVLGEALYSNDELAVCAGPTPNFDEFWHGAPIADAELRSRYLTWIKASCLKPGDFYAPDGLLPACEGILQVMRSVEFAQTSGIEVAANIQPKLRSAR
jgi:capsular polysaccharide export protein